MPNWPMRRGAYHKFLLRSPVAPLLEWPMPRAQRIMTPRSTTALLLGACLAMALGVAWAARSELLEVKDRTPRAPHDQRDGRRQCVPRAGPPGRVAQGRMVGQGGPWDSHRQPAYGGVRARTDARHRGGAGGDARHGHARGR